MSSSQQTWFNHVEKKTRKNLTMWKKRETANKTLPIVDASKKRFRFICHNFIIILNGKSRFNLILFFVFAHFHGNDFQISLWRKYITKSTANWQQDRIYYIQKKKVKLMPTETNVPLIQLFIYVKCRTRTYTIRAKEKKNHTHKHTTQNVNHRRGFYFRWFLCTTLWQGSLKRCEQKTVFMFIRETSNH